MLLWQININHINIYDILFKFLVDLPLIFQDSNTCQLLNNQDEFQYENVIIAGLFNVYFIGILSS